MNSINKIFLVLGRYRNVISTKRVNKFTYLSPSLVFKYYANSVFCFVWVFFSIFCADCI